MSSFALLHKHVVFELLDHEITLTDKNNQGKKKTLQVCVCCQFYSKKKFDQEHHFEELLIVYYNHMNFSFQKKDEILKKYKKKFSNFFVNH